MMSQAIAIIGAIQGELLLFGAFWFLVGAIDDLCIDVAWIGIQVSRRFRTSRIESLSDGQGKGQDGPMAVFVPVWAESAVIGTMLQNCLVSWKDSPHLHYIYVGYYPNDPASRDCIMDVAKNAPHIRPVLIDHDGPTTKADSLNSLWAAMVEDESAGGYKCKAVILQDRKSVV